MKELMCGAVALFPCVGAWSILIAADVVLLCLLVGAVVSWWDGRRKSLREDIAR